MYEKIANHFKTMNDPEEAKVLNKHAINGFKYCAKLISKKKKYGNFKI